MWPHETTSGRGRDVGALRVTACACLRTLRADFTYFTFRGEIHCEMKCEMDQSFHCEITFPAASSLGLITQLLGQISSKRTLRERGSSEASLATADAVELQSSV